MQTDWKEHAEDALRLVRRALHGDPEALGSLERWADRVESLGAVNPDTDEQED